MIIYIRGFNIVNDQLRSWSADIIQKHLGIDVVTLNYDVRDPVGSMERMIEEASVYADEEELMIFGSSLGGFMAAVLAAKIGCKLVLFNPSLSPTKSLLRYVGEDFTTKDVEKYSEWDIDEVLDTITKQGFGGQIYVTDDPVVNPSYAIDKIIYHETIGIYIKNQFDVHRLTDEIIINISEDLQRYHYSISG